MKVIVVDDGSVDATADIVLSFAKKAGANSDLIRLCRFCKNRGKGISYPNPNSNSSEL